jgi:hypothetical protein
MGYAREDLATLIQSIDGKQDELLKNMPAGSYRITLSTPGANHMSFSDEPLLEAEDDDSLRILEIVRAYTRAFFEKTLLGNRKKEHSPRHGISERSVDKSGMVPSLGETPVGHRL